MAPPSARTLRPQDQIAHYRIVGPLGAGGMGEVYLAQDQKLDRNVALKILPPELVRSEERVQRFVLEAKSASSLSHPNIVTIYEIGQDAVRAAGAPDSSPVHFISAGLPQCPLRQRREECARPGRDRLERLSDRRRRADRDFSLSETVGRARMGS